MGDRTTDPIYSQASITLLIEVLFKFFQIFFSTYSFQLACHPVSVNPDEYSSSKGVSQTRENQPVGSSGEIDSGQFTLESIRRSFFEYTGKILGGLLIKSENDLRVWEDRLQEAQDCIEWYQNLVKKCEKEISVTKAQMSEVANMLSQLEKE